MRKHIKKVRSGYLKYEPYTIDKKNFVEQSKTGLMDSLVRINNNIYEIEVQIDKVNSTNYD